MDEAVGVGVEPAERAATPGPRPSCGGGCRRDASRRRCSVLLRGADLELLSREPGVTAAELRGWRDQFLAAGGRLPPPPPSGAPTQETWAARPDGGRGPGRGDPATAGRQPVPRRGPSQAVGQAALCRCPHHPSPGSPAHARARPAGSPAHWPTGLQRRHDHRSRYVSHHVQAEIRFLGIEGSPAFVREPKATAAPSGSSGP